MRILQLLPLALAFCLLSTSCDNDFSPNGEWRETMVVYGLLDQDSDTSWIRIQKCYLGKGDMLAMSSIIDSSNYPEGDLSVKIVEWNANENASGSIEKTTESGKVFNFNYKVLSNKQEGEFYAPEQPVYYCVTKNQLDENKIYELRIHNNKTGLDVNAETPLIGSFESNSIKVNNSNLGIFTFQNGKASLQWPNAKRARVYQPMIRFFYRNVSSDSLMHVDVLFSTREVTNELVASTQISRTFFGNEIAKLITDHDTPKIMGDSIALYLFAGDENLKMYRSISAPPNTIVQERGIYSNINGGLGLFAARRIHIYREMPIPLNTNDPNFRGLIRGLEIGF